MIAFHPPLSGAPLAFAISLIIVEIGGRFSQFRRGGSVIKMFLVGACLISVGLAFVSGYQASWGSGDLSGVADEVMATHHMLGRFLLLNSGMLAVFYFLSRYASNGRKVLAVLYYLCLCAQIVLTLQVGGLGGELVFSHGVGVKILP